MRRASLVWGGVAAAILLTGSIAIGVVIATTATPAAHVERYLDALARDDLVSAARLAGLQPPSPMPLGDEGEPGIRQIISSTGEADGTVTVVAEYGTGQDAVRVPFRLEAAPPRVGFVPEWRFVSPPVVTFSVGADQHDRVAVNERHVVASRAGETVAVTIFIPARATVRLDEPLLRADPITLRAGLSAPSPVLLMVEADARLERAVQRELDRQLAECTTQRVLQPTGCPFGAEIDDRIIADPEWRLDDAPDLIIEPSDRAGIWSVRGEGAVQLAVTVQQLFDGAVVERDEAVGFVVRGEVVLEPEGPVLTIYPPGG